MSDDGFDFRPQPERREVKKQFEPPPWEREAFEEMQRRKAEQAKQPVAAEADQESVADQRPEPLEARPAPEIAGSAQAESEPEDGQAQRGTGLDDATVIELMAGLAAEDPPAEHSYFGVAMGASLFLAALGAVLLIWGVAALVGARVTGAVGTFAGTGLGLFGAGFLAGGIWMAYQALKRRGVL